MEKPLSVLTKFGQDMAEKMSPAQRAEAKQIWDAMSSEGMTDEIMLAYNTFSAKVYGIQTPSPVMPLGRTATGSIKIRIQKKAPEATEFVLFMLPRERREDVFNDLNDWYPSWCEKFGTRPAKFLCWYKVACCVGGAIMEVMGRVGEFIGKVAPK